MARIDRYGRDCPCLEHPGCPGRVLEATHVDTRGPGPHHNARCHGCGARFRWDGARLTYLDHVRRP